MLLFSKLTLLHLSIIHRFHSQSSVYRNGDPLTLPAKILLVKATLQNWESVLDEITRKVSLTNSAVLK